MSSGEMFHCVSEAALSMCGCKVYHHWHSKLRLTIRDSVSIRSEEENRRKLQLYNHMDHPTCYTVLRYVYIHIDMYIQNSLHLHRTYRLDLMIKKQNQKEENTWSRRTYIHVPVMFTAVFCNGASFPAISLLARLMTESLYY